MNLSVYRMYLTPQYWKDKIRLLYSQFENIVLVESPNQWVKVCDRFACRFTHEVCVQKEVCNSHKNTDWEDEKYYYTDCTGCKYNQVSCVGKWFLTFEEKEKAYKEAISGSIL